MSGSDPPVHSPSYLASKFMGFLETEGVDGAGVMTLGNMPVQAPVGKARALPLVQLSQ